MVSQKEFVATIFLEINPNSDETHPVPSSSHLKIEVPDNINLSDSESCEVLKSATIHTYQELSIESTREWLENKESGHVEYKIGSVTFDDSIDIITSDLSLNNVYSKVAVSSAD